MTEGSGKIETFFRENTLRSIFSRSRKVKDGDDDPSLAPIPPLSPTASSVVSRCLRFLSLSPDEFLQTFEKDVPANAMQDSRYERALIEYCSFRTIHLLTQRVDYLADKEFRRLTFDMMLAWETPGVGSKSIQNEIISNVSPRHKSEDDGSYFSSNPTSLALEVDCKKTVGVEAFARIATACPAIADVVTVRNLFDALASSSSGQLHFLIYSKYLGSLNKVFRSVRNLLGSSASSSLRLQPTEIILDVDGTSPTQPVLQHVGKSAWPGRLTLTSRSVYFESLGMGSYDKAVIYDLAADEKQIIRPDLTGPLGARLFDKAVMYKSSTMEEPAYFEFPEFRGHSRRDYWLSIISEVAYIHKFIRDFKLGEIPKMEALSKTIIAIIQYRAIKEAFHVIPSRFKTLLPFNLAEELPKGDEILKALYNYLKNVQIPSRVQTNHDGSLGKITKGCQLPVSLLVLGRMGFSFCKDVNDIDDQNFPIDAYIGEISPLEVAVNRSLNYSGPVEAAYATVEQVKVEGLGTNITLMKELLFPLIWIYNCFRSVHAWENSFKSTIFLALMVCIILRGWVRHILPSILAIFAILMIWNKCRNKGKPLKTLVVTLSGSSNTVDQLLTLQDAISQFETLAQEGNIILLKLRAIFFSALPQATNCVAMALFAAAVVVALVPPRYLVVLMLLEIFTRNMPLRKAMGETLVRRMREWWIHIPAAPVELIKAEESKKKK